MPSATSWLCHICPSGSNPSHCLTFGIWGTLSYSERCHSELDARPEVISLSGLSISLRRATLEWCGGLQFSPQHKYMCMHAISNIMIMSCMSFWQQSSTLSDVWDLGNLILLWALSFRVGCAAWGHFVVRFGNFTKAGNPRVVRRAPILTATQMHVHACHQQHHDYVMYVLLAAILHIVWRLGSVVWGTLSYSERCHSELDVRPEVIIPSSSLSGLVISPRRAIFQWCGGGYNSHRNTMTRASTRSTFGATIAALLV